MARRYTDPPIGPVLRAVRRSRGWTIQEVAERAQVHLVYYGDIERCKRNPTAEILDRILPALNLSWGEFGRAIDERRSDPGAAIRDDQ